MSTHYLKYFWIVSALINFHFITAQTITGRVSDADGVPLSGVNVVVKGTTQGTLTDFDGIYTIEDVRTDAILVFSYIGFKTQERTVRGQTTVNIVMEEDVQALQGVVVESEVGYGQRQNRKVISTAITTIALDQIEKLPVSRPERVLQGTPGTTVVQTSGSPGAPLTIRLRGVGTVNNSDPVYIVDGIQVPDIQHLNAGDINSFTTLKDGAAAAIYGARGGNGVVLVETKKGRKGRKLSVTLNGYYGFQSLLNKPDVMNRDQYVNYYNQFAANSGGAFTPISDGDRTQLENTDWYDEIFDSGVPMRNLHLSVANGGEKFAYYLSGGLFGQDGLIGGDRGKSNYDRKNLNFNFEGDILTNLNIVVAGNIVSETRNQLAENNAGTGNAILNYLPALPAIYPLYDTANNVPYDMGQFGTGTVNGVVMPFAGVGAITNPIVPLLHQDDEILSDISTYNIKATWEPVAHLKLSSDYGFYRDLSQRRQFTEAYDYRAFGHNIFNLNGIYTETDFKNQWTQWNGVASYDFQNVLRNEKHALEAILGFSVYKQEFSTKTRSGAGFSVNTFDEANFALINDPTTITNFTPVEGENGLLGVFTRILYNYDEKYLFSATFRRDESSNFGPDNRAGFFPSFSAGWVISEEDFFNSAAINLLKLRGSWGVNGIDNVPANQFVTILNSNVGPSFNDANTPGVSSNFLPNPGIQWEEVTQANVGLDLNAFNNTLGMTLEYYNKKTTEMLLPGNLPLYTGSIAPFSNVGSVTNSGFEALVSFRQQYDSGLRWNTSFNIAVNNNEVSSLAGGQPLPGGNIGFIFNDPITLSAEGQPIASFYGLKVREIDANGTFVFEDLNNDGAIDADDRTFIGNPFPDFTYGLTVGAGYQGFDFNAFFYGSQGNDIYDATTRLDAPFANRPVSYLEAGAPANLLSGATGSDQTEVSDFYVKDGSFLKLRTLTLGYSLPTDALKAVKLSKVRFYVTAQNLFVITDYDGVDPEIGTAFSNTFLDVGIDRGFNPQPRTFLFGFQFQF